MHHVRVRSSLLVLFSFVSFLPAAQAQQVPKVVRMDYDMRKLAEPPKLSEEELAGRRMFVQRCALCHHNAPSFGPSGPALNADVIKTGGEANARERIQKGSRRMPGFQYVFELAQVEQIIAFLKTVTEVPKSPKPGAER